MTRSTACFVFLVLSTSYAVGCGEDVGPCNDPKEGRDTVLSGGTIQYAGQAIMNKSCATGCHSSNASGEGRRGAPAGLNFDLLPVSEGEAKGKQGSADTTVKLSSSQRALLSKNQEVVYENRDLIWQQVRDGLMPPDGMFESFKSLANVFQTKESEPCKQGKKLLGLDSQQQVLRNWLACGAPIVESSGSVVTEPETAGVIGYQYPACGEGPGGIPLADEPVTLEGLMQAQFANCGGACHPGLNKVNFSTLQGIMTDVVSPKAMVCNGKPYITKGDPAKSFLYDMLAKDNPGCNHMRMPWGFPPLVKEQLKQVADWIEAGAPATEDDVGEEPEEPGEEPEEPVEPEEDAGEPEEPEEDAGTPSKDAGAGDAGRDAGRDAGAVDAGRDAGRDAAADARRPFPF